MAFNIPTAADLGLYLGLDEIDGTRADFLIARTVDLAFAAVGPLPGGAETVVLSAASRAYTNPSGATYETIGPMSVQRPPAGLYLTRAEERALKRMAGKGGAFTVDPTSTTADPSPTWLADVVEPGWTTQ